ncbi:MAG TPA: glycosyltransferase family 9 protein [Candidatus Binataceae bacterium]|nr:glycosyltransferase family 9 protein [Candidatus Binataceae bacterium]
MASRVLIIFPGALGDLMLLAPTIAAISRRHRGAELDLMARYELAEFAVGRLGIARAHSIDRREVALLFQDGDRASASRFFGAFDRIYCFFNADDPDFRRRLIEACAYEVTFHRFRPDAEGHVAAAYMKDVTGDAKLEDASINLLPKDIQEAVRIVEAKNFIAIFPGSGSTKKNWPVEKFCALADSLNDKTPAVFICGPAEYSLANVIRASGHVTIENLPLGTVAAIARMASVFVGNDSGISHLAAATGTRGVVLFGSTDPAKWRPLGRVTVLHREPIDSISVGDVMAALGEGIS